MTGQTKADEVLAPAAARQLYWTRLSRLPGWLRSGLFRQSPAGRPGWRQVLAGAAFVVAGAAVSLARTSGPGALNTIWIEDANNFLQDALHQSVMTTITTQMNGYYDVVPRIATAIAVAFPLTWAPGIMSAFAAVGYALFALLVYVASGPCLRRPWLRLLVSAPVCVVPLAYTQVNNDLATVQFIALYGLFWLLLWRPVSRWGQLTAPLVMLGTTLSSILPFLFAPLVAARLIADRSRTSVAVAVCWAAGLLTQWSVQWRGMSNRSSALYTSPLWVLGQYVTRVVPRAIFGELALGGPGTNGEGHPIPLRIPNMAVHDALIWGACAIVVLAVVVALAGRTAPAWPIAVTALVFSVLLFLGEIVDNLPIVQPRYVIAPALLLYTAIAAMLRPRGVADDTSAADGPEGAPGGDAPATAAPRRLWPAVASRTPVTVFALLLAVVIGFNYRVVNNRSESPPWTVVVATATHTCQMPGLGYQEPGIGFQKPGAGYFEYRHAWWRLQIPCSRV